MENQERVLAYKLAKELSLQDIQEVSGGANGFAMSQRTTAAPSGGSPSNIDVTVDVVVDF